MHDPPRRRAGPGRDDLLDEPPESLGMPGPYGPLAHAVRTVGGAGGDDDASLTTLPQALGHAPADAATVGEHQPVAADIAARGSGEDHGLAADRAPGARLAGQGASVGEALLGQQRAPAGGRQQRIRRPQIGVGEPPPALGEPEREVDPPVRRGALEQHEQAVRREQAASVAERAAKVPGGVEHVGGDDEVEAVRRKALRLGIALDVEAPAGQGRRGAESLGGPGQEQRREIGEHVLGAGRQRLQQRRGGGAGPGADLQHAQAPARRQRGHRRLDGAAGQRVEDARDRAGRVETLDRLEIALREQQRERIGAAQHRRQPRPAAIEHRELGRRRHAGALARLARRGADQRSANRPGVGSTVDGVEHAVLAQHRQHPAEQPPVGGDDAELRRQRGRLDTRARARIPAELAQRPHRVIGGDDLERGQGGIVGVQRVRRRQRRDLGLEARDDLGRRGQRRGRRHGQRHRRPRDLVAPVRAHLGRRGQRLARQPPELEPARGDEDAPGAVEHGDVAGGDLGDAPAGCSTACARTGPGIALQTSKRFTAVRK